MSGAVTATLLSAGLGLGLLMTYRGLRGRPVPLADTIAALHGPASPMGEPGDDGYASPEQLPDWQRRLGRYGLWIVASVGIGESVVLSERLRILHKPPERHAYEKVLGAVVGFVLPNLVLAAVATSGAAVSPLVGLLSGVAAGAAGFFYPDLPLAEQVEKRQAAFRHALSSYLDLVTIILAGGGGIESALQGAADAGDGWAFAEIRGALRRAQLTGRTPWELFEELGVTLDISELRELASSVALAGSQGAKVRQSLTAKADALRARQAAAIETNAETRTEKMIVPVTVMIVGLTLFIGYGAVQAITTDGAAVAREGPQIGVAP